MTVRIGYACLAVGVLGTGQKTVKQQNATDEKLVEIIGKNLDSLDKILDYNQENDIRLFRISSDLIPFGSSPVNRLLWWDIFKDIFLALGEKIKRQQTRVSMHPGQYTLLNSTREEVVERAITDLTYHGRVLEAMGLDEAHKIILHIGGAYGNKQEAADRFISKYHELDPEIKKRLVIENDDRSFTVEDVLEISVETGAPVVFDNLHHQVNPPDTEKSVLEWITACKQTWKLQDGPQKIHYSQQDLSKRPGAHSSTIRIREFLNFHKQLGSEDPDIMLEVKDKNLSAVKCINCTLNHPKIEKLEVEWSRYKYNVLESSPEIYLQIRALLKDKAQYPALEFYELIERSLQEEVSKGNVVNALQHVWGYFKKTASSGEKERFFGLLEGFQANSVSGDTIRNYLWKLALKQEQEYLLKSYYLQNLHL